jgi:hypothetical protein
VALAMAGGCGGGPATVTGKVTYRGRPVTRGAVVFLSADKTARSGVIQPDGSYTVANVPRGMTRIGVVSRDPATGRGAWRKRRSRPPGTPLPATPGWFPLPSGFETPETSGLSCTVAGGRFHYDIDLK